MPSCTKVRPINKHCNYWTIFLMFTMHCKKEIRKEVGPIGTNGTKQRSASKHMESHSRLPYLSGPSTLMRAEIKKHKEKYGEKNYWKTQWVFRWFPTPYHRPRWVSAPHLSAVLALELLHCWSEDQIWCFCRYWSKLCHVGKNQSVQSPSSSCT